MESDPDKLREELKKKTIPELRKECKELNVPDCLTRITTFRKQGLIELIVLAKSKPSKRKSPKRKPSKRKPSKRKPSKRKSPKRTGKPLTKMTVKELNAIIKKEKVKLPSKGSGKNGSILKKDKIKAIMDARAKKSPIKEIEVPRRVSPTKPTRQYKCYPNRKRKCPKGSDKPYCSTKTGNCRKTKTINKDQKEKGFIFDQELGIIVPRDELQAYRDYLKEEEEGPSRRGIPVRRRRRVVQKPLRKAPKPGTRKCYDKEDWLECDSDQVCWSDGTCRPSGMGKDLWGLQVENRGYNIVGSEEHVRRLQEEIGGEVVPPRKVMKEVEKKVKDKGKEKITPPRRSPVRRTSTKKPSRRQPSAMVEAKKADIVKTFMECLENYSQK